MTQLPTIHVSPVRRTQILRIVSIVALFLVGTLGGFTLGVKFGERKAQFQRGFNQNYERNMMRGGPSDYKGGDRDTRGDSRSGMNFGPRHGFGIAGTVLSVADGNTSLVLKDKQDKENTISITAETVVQDGETKKTAADIVDGAMIMVIGKPLETGVVEAKFIRILPATTPAAVPTPTPAQ